MQDMVSLIAFAKALALQILGGESRQGENQRETHNSAICLIVYFCH